MTCACFHLHTCWPIGVRNVAHMLPFFIISLCSRGTRPCPIFPGAAAASEACGVPQETQSTFRWFDMEVDQNGVMVMSNNLLLEIRERKREGGEREREMHGETKVFLLSPVLVSAPPCVSQIARSVTKHAWRSRTQMRTWFRQSCFSTKSRLQT